MLYYIILYYIMSNYVILYVKGQHVTRRFLGPNDDMYYRDLWAKLTSISGTSSHTNLFGAARWTAEPLDLSSVTDAADKGIKTNQIRSNLRWIHCLTVDSVPVTSLGY